MKVSRRSAQPALDQASADRKRRGIVSIAEERDDHTLGKNTLASQPEDRRSYPNAVPTKIDRDCRIERPSACPALPNRTTAARSSFEPIPLDLCCERCATFDCAK